MKKNTQININGQMSRKGADMTARLYAVAALIAAVGIAAGTIIFAISNLIPVL